jgi:hypothetical protein
MEDADLWARIASAAPVAYVPEPLTIVRKHSTNLTGRYDLREYIRAWLKVLDKAAANLPPGTTVNVNKLRAHVNFVGWNLAEERGDPESYRYLVEAIRHAPEFMMPRMRRILCDMRDVRRILMCKKMVARVIRPVKKGIRMVQEKMRRSA